MTNSSLKTNPPGQSADPVLSFLPGASAGAAFSGPAPVLPTDTRSPARIGLWALGLGFGGFLLWSALAPLDEGVPAQAVVSIDTKRKAVQHLMGGIVKQVHVKEGTTVKQGDPLVDLDDATIRANYETIRQHYLTLRATEGRLLAEQAGSSRIEIHPDLKKTETDPYVRQVIDNQTQLLATRRLAYEAEQRSFVESMQGYEASIEGSRGMLDTRRDQLNRLQDELNGVRDLVKEGYAPLNQQRQLERQLSETQGNIVDLQAGIQRNQRAIAELKARSNLRTQEFNKEVATHLAEIRSEVQADADKYKAVAADLDRTVIRAPVDGQVIGLAIQNAGAVVSPGQKLMDIVPQNETLLLEAHVAPNLIDKIQAGLPVDARFSAFANSPALVVHGKVDSISADLLSDPANNNRPYFLARVSVTPEGMKQLGNRQMQAGMPAEIIIKTGERSLLAYLVHPLIKRVAASMKEE